MCAHGKNASDVSSGVTSFSTSLRRTAAEMFATKFACVSSTPFGLPVVPLV